MASQPMIERKPESSRAHGPCQRLEGFACGDNRPKAGRENGGHEVHPQGLENYKIKVHGLGPTLLFFIVFLSLVFSLRRPVTNPPFECQDPEVTTKLMIWLLALE